MYATLAAALGSVVLAQTITGDVSGSWATATGSTTPRYLADRLASRIDVKDFGASGTGDATKDTLGVAAAIAAAPNGATVVFPSGTYVLDVAAFGTSNYAQQRVQYADLGGPRLTRTTIVQVLGKTDLTLRGEGLVNVVVRGSDPERVAFFFRQCMNVKVENMGFGLSNSATSQGGTTQLATENWYPIALEGTTGFEVSGCTFSTPRTAIFADAYYGAPNVDINVHDNRFYYVANHSLMTRNADGVRFSGNRCEGTGRNYHTDGEDVALSDKTTNAAVANNVFVNPLGVQSRVTSTRSLGPTAITGNVKTGPGIFVEICDASNVSVSGNSSTGTDKREHVLFTSHTNTNNEHVTITGNTFLNGGMCISDYYAGTNVKDGLVFANNICSNTYGPQAWNSRSGVVFEGNRFDLNSAGQEIRIGGYGLVFKGNSIKNGYLSLVDNGAAIVEGNYFLGSGNAPLPYALNVSGTFGHQVRGNWFEAGSYVDYLNKQPASKAGFRYLDVGLSTKPDVAMPNKLSCRVGDTIENDTPVEAGSAGARFIVTGWKCVSADAWVPMRALTGN